MAASIMSSGSIGESFSPVFLAELEDVAKRRGMECSGDMTPVSFPLPDFQLQQPSETLRRMQQELDEPDQNRLWQEAEAANECKQGLVGLALSGGGIRSSTFNLGVLQALDRVGLFKHIDYLSTVSGGGYIGTYLTTSIKEDLDSAANVAPTNAAAENTSWFPFRHTTGAEESRRFRHLRNFANYLAPGGKSEVLAIPIVLLRGAVVQQLFLLPMLALVALTLAHLLDFDGSRYYFPLAARYVAWLSSTPLAGLVAVFERMPFTVTIAALLLAAFCLFPFIELVRDALGRMDRRDWREHALRGLAITVMLGIVVAFVELQPILLTLLHEGLGGWLVPVAGGTTLTVAVADKLIPRLRSLYARLGVALYGIIGLIVFWLILLWFTARMGPAALDPWSHGAVLLLAGLLLLYSLAMIDLNHTSLHRFYRDRLVRAFVAQAAEDDDPGNAAHNEPPAKMRVPKLSELDNKRAPYHLINATVNVARRDSKYRNGRNGSFFVFSKRFCGGIRGGYCATTALEAIARSLDVGTAMAISGAAIAPNSGKFTNPLMTFLMAALNLRLNYWLPNPGLIKSATYWRRCLNFCRIGPAYLLYEMFRRHLSEDARYLNLSDGGHIENLGLYELLRRQCRLIIIGDGECDVALRFEGLAEAIRLARIDFGFQIEMDGLDELRAGDRQFATGRVRYDTDRYGVLIYLKSNLGGDYNLKAALDMASAHDGSDQRTDEFYRTSPRRDDDFLYDDNPYLAHYRSRHAHFPHESTADQFFDEAQFECYRALGFSVAAKALLAPWRPNTTNQGEPT